MVLAFLPSLLFGLISLGFALLAGLREQPRAARAGYLDTVRNRSLVALAAIAAFLCAVCLLLGLALLAIHGVVGDMPPGREPFD
jgi:hypothetical protein